MADQKRERSDDNGAETPLVDPRAIARLEKLKAASPGVLTHG